jgi:ABC-type Fe3+/spermidine/putrescine transport system ATPase subunit
LLHAGTIIRVGTPERVWSAPGTEAAARLLGITTIVDVTVGRDGVSLSHGDGRRARAIVREEAVRIAADGAVRGVVEDALFRGPGHLLRVGVPGGMIAVVHHERVEPGQTVGLDVPQEAFTLLDG